MNPDSKPAFRLIRQCLALLVAGFCATHPAWAAPTGAVVAHGQASFNSQGNTLTITNSPGTIIDWQGFSIAPHEAARFVQQSSQSAVLNRVVGSSRSEILGSLLSNGQVYLINPNGIMFGAGARVDVAGLIASSLQLSNQDFLAGRINFSGSPGAGALQNQGSLTTPSGGRIYLIAPRVENSGLINAPNGDILLAAGHQVSLVDSSNPDLRVVVSAPDAMALNLGQIMAASGRIGIHAALLQQSGRISADAAVQGEGGRIFLKASEHAHLTAGSATTARGNSGGQVRVDAAGDGVLAGRVDVSASQGSGGQVQLLGKRVAVEATGSVDASGPLGGGQILVGGDYRGENPAVRSASQTRLDSGARLDADATLQGDGGKVIVWGNETTQAHGEISARGGARGGNGGLVETSAQYLDTQGARVDTRAPLGRTGTWLLDPINVFIENSTGDPAGNLTGGTWTTTSTGASSTIYTVDLETQLGSSNVTIDSTTGATSGTASPGSITVQDSFSWTSGNTLTLTSEGGISINANITGGSGTLLAHAGGLGISTINAAISVAQIGLVTSGPIQMTGTSLEATSVSLQGADIGQDTTSGIIASSLIARSSGSNGIGLPNENQIATLQAEATNAGSIQFNNIGNLFLSHITTQGGGVSISTSGSLTSSNITTQGGSVSLSAGGNLNNQPPGIDACGTVPSCMSSVHLVSSSGSITTALIKAGVGVNLEALNGNILDGDGSANNIVSGGANPILLTYKANITSGTVDLDAWGANIDLNSTAASVNIRTAAPPPPPPEPPPPPTLDECIANSVLAGCGAVLPSLESCTATPGLPGCSAVLPSLSACTSAPATPGCSAVLPSLSSCTTAPATPGCSAVLPSLSACTSAPATPGCSAVLPSLSSCTATPGLPGCSAVLPSLSACTSAPATPGCSAVLPSLESCSANPGQAGCAVVLPPLVDCTTNPGLAGCTAVLPALSDCSTAPNQAGCAVVLPPAQLIQLERQQQPELAQATDQNVQGCQNMQSNLTGPDSVPAPGTRPRDDDTPPAASQASSGTRNGEQDNVPTPPAFCN